MAGTYVEDLRSLDLFLPLTGGGGALLAVCMFFLKDVDDPWMPVAGWVRALSALDVPDPSARTALRRLSQGGHLAREARDGVPGYAMSPALTHVLQVGEVTRSTDPRWLLVTLSVPESQRKLRHQLRTLLLRGGFGPLGNGVWIGRPHNAEHALDYTELLGTAPYTQMFIGEFIGPGELPALVERCWDLPAVAADYLECARAARETEARQPSTGPECFAAVVRTAMARAVVLSKDPKLPPEALPADWPGPAALSEVDAVIARYRRRATRWFRDLAASGA